MSVPHVTRAPVPPASPVPTIRLAGPCASCRSPLVVTVTGTWHWVTGTVSCRPVIDAADGGWSEPDDWSEGPCAAPRRADRVAS